MNAPPTSPDEPICGNCGYVLSGLTESSKCPECGRPFDPDDAISWVKGHDLLRREPCWLPAEIVHTDYTLRPDGYFLAGSNGLASGNYLVEAVNALLRLERV